MTKPWMYKTSMSSLYDWRTVLHTVFFELGQKIFSQIISCQTLRWTIWGCWPHSWTPWSCGSPWAVVYIAGLIYPCWGCQTRCWTSLHSWSRSLTLWGRRTCCASPWCHQTRFGSPWAHWICLRPSYTLAHSMSHCLRLKLRQLSKFWS